jgi:DNA-binding NarL/FixJ family response regulator
VLEALNAQARSLPVLVASGFLTPELEAQAVSLGASTAAKPLPLEELLGFAAAAIAERHGLDRPLARAAARFSWEHRLTAREHDIVALTMAGVTDRAVLADVLGCSPLTVKTHVAEILVKVGAGSLLEVAMLVMRRDGLH